MSLCEKRRTSSNPAVSECELLRRKEGRESSQREQQKRRKLLQVRGGSQEAFRGEERRREEVELESEAGKVDAGGLKRKRQPDEKESLVTPVL